MEFLDKLIVEACDVPSGESKITKAYLKHWCDYDLDNPKVIRIDFEDKSIAPTNFLQSYFKFDAYVKIFKAADYQKDIVRDCIIQLPDNLIAHLQREFDKLENEFAYYGELLDEIFANGNMWKHRTFRTVLDDQSSEWDNTAIETKREIIEKINNSSYSLEKIIEGYKREYSKHNRNDIVSRIEESLKKIHIPAAKPAKLTNQQVCMAGEFFVAAELFRRNFQVSITYGNAKSLDIIAKHAITGKHFDIEVKTLQKLNCFDLSFKNISNEMIYFFVVLGEETSPPTFFILDGKTIINDPENFYGKSLKAERQTVNYGPLLRYKDNWEVLK